MGYLFVLLQTHSEKEEKGKEAMMICWLHKQLLWIEIILAKVSSLLHDHSSTSTFHRFFKIMSKTDLAI
jgi:hypothetical protein